jgi:hypothetical protein
VHRKAGWAARSIRDQGGLADQEGILEALVEIPVAAEGS